MDFPLYTVTGQEEYYFNAMSDGFCFGTAQNVIIDHCIDLNITGLQRIANLQNDRCPIRLAASRHIPKIAGDWRSNDALKFGIDLYDVDTRKRSFTLDCNPDRNCRIVDFAFSPNGPELVSCSLDEIKLWDVDTASLLTTVETEGDYLRFCNFTCDGTKIVLGKNFGFIELWDIELQNRVSVLKNDFNVRKCVPLREELIVTASGDTVSVWDTKSRQRVSTMNIGSSPDYILWAQSVDLSVSSDCVTIASATQRTLWLWDLRTQKCFATLEKNDNGIVGCDITPDGSSLVLGARGSLAIWNIKSLKLVTRTSTEVSSFCVTFDGLTIVTASNDLMLWNTVFVDNDVYEAAVDRIENDYNFAVAVT